MTRSLGPVSCGGFPRIVASIRIKSLGPTSRSLTLATVMSRTAGWDLGGSDSSDEDVDYRERICPGWQ